MYEGFSAVVDHNVEYDVDYNKVEFTDKFRGDKAPIEAVKDKLDDLQELSVNAVEFMPWTAWPEGDFSWAALYHSTLFKGVRPPLIERCLQQCEQRRLAAGEILLSPSQQNDYLFIVLAGRLAVYLNYPDNASLTYLETGECIGEISILDQQNPSAFVVAREASVVLAIVRDILWALFDESSQIARNLLHILVKRTRYNLAAILDREQLAYLAYFDTLTGLRNRRWLETIFARVQKSSQINDRSLYFIMVDVDHFKRFNDHYGHLAGDQVLRAVAESLSGNMRPHDMIARFGGEEFVILLPGVGLQDALAIAERLRKGVSSKVVTITGLQTLPPVTVSLGIARMLPDDTLEELVARADAALYQAKAEGRNRVAL